MIYRIVNYQFNIIRIVRYDACEGKFNIIGIVNCWLKWHDAEQEWLHRHNDYFFSYFGKIIIIQTSVLSVEKYLVTLKRYIKSVRPVQNK